MQREHPLYKYCSFSICPRFSVAQTPQTLDDLQDRIDLHENLNNSLEEVEAKFTPLHEQFAILEKVS